jgi:hypothetical protein
VDTNALVFVVAGLVVVFVAGFWLFQSRAKGRVKAPGFEAEFEGSNDPQAPGGGIKAEDVKAGRDIKVDDATGVGIEAKRLEAKRDVSIGTRSGDAKKA